MLPGADAVKEHISVFRLHFLLFPGVAALSRSHSGDRPESGGPPSWWGARKVHVPLCLLFPWLGHPGEIQTCLLSVQTTETDAFRRWEI